MNVLNPDMNQPSNTANHVEPSPLMRHWCENVANVIGRSPAPTTGTHKNDLRGTKTGTGPARKRRKTDKVPYAEAVQTPNFAHG